jgi:hypothetical protein
VRPPLNCGPHGRDQATSLRLRPRYLGNLRNLWMIYGWRDLMI